MKDIAESGAHREDPPPELSAAQPADPDLPQPEEPGAQRLAGEVLAGEVLAAISAVRRVTRRAARSAWRAELLPPAQSELLRLAAARPGISVAEAAHELRLAPNTVSTLVGRLTAAGSSAAPGRRPTGVRSS